MATVDYLEPRREKRHWVLWSVFVVAALFAVSGLWDAYQTRNQPAPVTSGSSGSSAEQQSYISDMNPRLAEWDDAVSLAGQTPKIALSGPIATMQQIRRTVAAMPTYNNQSRENAQAKLLSSMDLRIQGYLAFVGGKSDTVSKGLFDAADTQQSMWQSAVTAMGGS